MRSRLDRLREGFGPAGLDALLVRCRPNVRYLSGFTGSFGALLVDGREAVLFTDSRYTLQAREEAAGVRVETVVSAPLGAALSACGERARVGFEADHLSVSAHRALAARAGGRELVPTTGVVERLRAIKEPEEMVAIRDSIRLNEKAFEAGVGVLRPGAVEAEIAAAIEREMRVGGATCPAFESIVASGPRGAWPHARASSRTVNRGEPVVIDIGAMLNGYASDMTRTVFLGEPGERGRRIYGAVLDALERAQEDVRPGAEVGKLDEAARKSLKDAGFEGVAFRHGTGHGIGLEVHEAPRIGREGKDVLAPGMVITLEPGVYVEGWGGVRIEDVVAVGDSGCRLLSSVSREMISV